MLTREIIAYGIFAVVALCFVAIAIRWNIVSPKKRFLRRLSREKKLRQSERAEARSNADAPGRVLPEESNE